MKKALALRLNRVLCPSLLCLFSVLSLVLLRPGIASAASAHPAQCSGWQIVSSPNTTSSFNVLNAVAAISSKNAWAVGYARNTYSGPYQALIERWDGSDWDLISSPNPGTVNVLNSIAAVSASDVWAVGSSDGKALIEHWNGSGWTVISSPDPGVDNTLNGITAISAKNIWAVGTSTDVNGNRQTLIEHWDGGDWDLVSSPNAASSDNVLNAVSASSAKNIWAVGTYQTSSFFTKTLIEHWDGRGWNIVPGVNPGPWGNILKSVVVLSPTNVWAAGEYINVMSSTAPTLVEHWNGTSWSVVLSPTVTFESNELSGIVAFSKNNIQAIGDDFDSGSSASLVEHWDGTAWTTVPGVNVPSLFNFLNGAARVPRTHKVWAVGFLTDGNGVNATTLTEISC